MEIKKEVFPARLEIIREIDGEKQSGKNGRLIVATPNDPYIKELEFAIRFENDMAIAMKEGEAE